MWFISWPTRGWPSASSWWVSPPPPPTPPPPAVLLASGPNCSHLLSSLRQAGTVIWIGILVYTDPAGIRTYLAAQVSEQSPLGDPVAGGLPPHLGGAPVFTGGDPSSTLSIHPAPDPTPLPDNQSEGHHGPARAGPLPKAPATVPQISWGAEDEEGWRRLSFRHWPSLFSYYNITLAKRWASAPPPRPPAVCPPDPGPSPPVCPLSGTSASCPSFPSPCT